MKRVLLALLLGLALAGGANAATCTIDQVPGATLLLPYFEVDIANPAGVDTLFTVNNASATAILTHVIVWTDMSVEALDFNMYLTGYDMQTVSMGLIVRDGILPVTASAGQDPGDAISNKGPLSQDINFASCNEFFPFDVPALDQDFLVNHLQAILTGGVSSIYGNCGGYPYGDDIARGYVTVDTVNSCTLLTPCDPGYFISGGAGIGTNQNVLWGNWFIVEGDENFAMGDSMVALEAYAPQIAPVGTFTNGTFWGRCGVDGIYGDDREPLPSIVGSNFFNNVAFTGGTDFVIWRDSEYASTDGFKCSSGPAWFPLPQDQVVIFDEEENPEEGGCTISPCPEEDVLFPIEAQRVPYAALGASPESGWIWMNLGQYGQYAQTWVVPLFKAEGRYAAGIAATQVTGSTCQDFTPILPIN